MFIAWCNENEGFFSLILSIIAIVISIIAINAQNKGVVFEKRLKLYVNANRISKSCASIAKCCKGRPATGQINLISLILFKPNSREAECLRELGSTTEQSEQYHQLLDTYTSICIDVYLKENEKINEELSVFYPPRIARYIQDLLFYYDELLMSFPILETAEIEEWINNVQKILDVIEEKNILKKMKRKMSISIYSQILDRSSRN